MLIKLPNGDWINPKTITAIQVLPASGKIDERVRIDAGHYSCMCTPEDEDAYAFADELAEQINRIVTT